MKNKKRNADYIIIYNKANLLYQPDAPISIRNYIKKNPLDEIRVKIELDYLDQYKNIDLNSINYEECKNPLTSKYPFIEVNEHIYSVGA